MNVAIINGSYEYAAMFLRMGFKVVEDIKEANLVCFTGGEDVTPSLYGAEKHPYTGNSILRDRDEAIIFQDALELKIPMVGICRGGQFLNVMSGGEMYQHVERHTRSHSITDLETGETVYVSSTHHQMMKPSSEAVLVASSTLGGEREWYEGQVFKKDVSTEDIEVVFYKDTQCLCFQPHPEFNGAQYEGMHAYFRSLLSRFFGM